MTFIPVVKSLGRDMDAIASAFAERMRQRRLQKHFGSWKVVANDKAHDIIMAKVMMMNYRRSAIASKFTAGGQQQRAKLRASRGKESANVGICKIAATIYAAHVASRYCAHSAVGV